MVDNLVIAPEIASALADGSPVVAMETTVFTHGLPAPLHMEVADGMRRAIRDEGAVPAVIGIVGGRARIGLDDAEIEHLATASDVLKISRRDIAFVMSRGRDGGTTVAGTVFLAALAGIRILATGGIGGVHRRVEDTMDVSGDLDELARSPVAVVCAGAKVILDLPRTLEYLETRGVPVVGFETDDFPAFYTRSSGLRAPCRLDGPESVAAMMAAHWSLGPAGGMVIANPPPSDSALDAGELETAIADALVKARSEGVSGAALTPYLLDRLGEITGGRSLKTNAALLVNNAGLGARIACAYHKSSAEPSG